MRWSKKDRKKLSNLARKFNSKLTRLNNQKPGGEEYLPERINVKELTEQIYSRQDFKRIINKHERFMKKGAEEIILSSKGIKTTKWEKHEVALAVAQINRNRTKERKKANVNTYKGTMGSIESNNLRPKKFNFENIKKSDWEKYMQNVEKQIISNYSEEKKERYKQNYLTCIESNLGDSDQAEGLYKFINSLDADFMYSKYYDDSLLQIQYISDPIPSAEIIDTLVEKWSRAIGRDREEIEKEFNIQLGDVEYADIWDFEE